MNKRSKAVKLQISDSEAWEYIVKNDALINWTLFKLCPKNWAMFAGGGQSADVVQQCRIRALHSVKTIGFRSVAIVNATRWELFEQVKLETERQEGMKSYSESSEGHRVSYDDPAYDPIKEYRTVISTVLRTLNYRQREVIKMRFGLGDGAVYTLEQVGEVFGRTKELIRGVQNKGLRKLAHHSRSKYLLSLLDGQIFVLNVDKVLKEGIDSPSSKQKFVHAGLVTSRIIYDLPKRLEWTPSKIPPDPFKVFYEDKQYRVIWSNIGVPEIERTKKFIRLLDHISMPVPPPWFQPIQ